MEPVTATSEGKCEDPVENLEMGNANAPATQQHAPGLFPTNSPTDDVSTHSSFKTSASSSGGTAVSDAGETEVRLEGKAEAAESNKTDGLVRSKKCSDPTEKAHIQPGIGERKVDASRTISSKSVHNTFTTAQDKGLEVLPSESSLSLAPYLPGRQFDGSLNIPRYGEVEKGHCPLVLSLSSGHEVNFQQFKIENAEKVVQGPQPAITTPEPQDDVSRGRQNSNTAEDSNKETERDKPKASENQLKPEDALQNQKEQKELLYMNPDKPQSCNIKSVDISLSSDKLQELQVKEPEEVVEVLSGNKEALSKLLQNDDEPTTDMEMMQVLLTCLAKVSQCETVGCGSLLTLQCEILNMVRASDFLQSLGTFLVTKSETAQMTELVNIIADSADLLRMVLTFFPSHVHSVLMVQAFMDIALKQLEQKGVETLPEIVAKKIEVYEITKGAALEGLQRGRKRAGNEDDLTPPDDFRGISVFPTIEDLESYSRPFLRKNKQTGGYASVDHYLDVQFRLLREDFISPLRDGIAEYQRMLAAPPQGRKRLKDIHVFHNVHILQAVLMPSCVGHRLTFDLTGLERVRWEVSKRLIYGSLVCLSSDDFRALYFATVTNRDPADLERGLVDVTFHGSHQEISAIPPETSFAMAESSAFFEAYRHVLAGLQTMHDDDLPFQDYIVYCKKEVAKLRYLTGDTQYDLLPLVDNRMILNEKGRSSPTPFEQTWLEFLERQDSSEESDQSGEEDDASVEKHGESSEEHDRRTEERNGIAWTIGTEDDNDGGVEEVKDREVGKVEEQEARGVVVLHRELWPDPCLLGLDGTQFEALHCALTRQFCLIQGPPGTGKTYVGLKIVKALLHNREAWDPERDSTMLIVCYTNHALDQFLEGIISFFPKGLVVRVGSRLRSEKLESYSLANLRKQFRKERSILGEAYGEISHDRREGHDHLEDLREQVEEMRLKVEVARHEIPHEELLKDYMLPEHYDRLYQTSLVIRTHAVPEWLGIDGVVKNSDMTLQDLIELEQELAQGGGSEEIEGEVQVLEDRYKLDTDWVSFGCRSKEDQVHRARQRHSFLAVDISRLDRGPGPGTRRPKKGRPEGPQITAEQRRTWKQQLQRKVSSKDRMTEQEERQVRNINKLNMPQRWRLYRLWTHKLCQDMEEEIKEKEEQYVEMAKHYEKTLMQEDKHIMKNATIIAMTTTAAAKYQAVLQEIKPKVIVVEEAAEVLEGHVITTLNQDCQHLILIGDHKQLRPNPTVYQLARKYNLELSLFERMINNGLTCNTLGWQHRMRPEIAELVQPIYPELQNHPSVEGYEAVKGVSSNLFFINHGEPETSDSETRSHSNAYEALYLTELCRYLLKQGYSKSKITILTPYSGQLFQLKKLMPKNSEFEGIRVTVVDNFQGEENDIILLSLVRSSEDGKIGFLKTENRVCVALSRAKIGLYVIGNFDQLSAGSDLWLTITTKLKEKGLLGEALNLYCQNHPSDDGLVIRTPRDFDRAPEGGCMKPCTARLDCGHTCTRLCHTFDMDHKAFNCTKPCERVMNCQYGHRCPKKCYQDCGPCGQKVEKTLPGCGHVQMVECGLDPYEFICLDKCLKTLECGHKCGERCGNAHKCYEEVEMTRPCGHSGTALCSARTMEPCSAQCGQLLACGHTCAYSCYDCQGERLHLPCKFKCTTVLLCGHKHESVCSKGPPVCKQQCKNICAHGVCPKKCGELCPPCRKPCGWRCPHHRCTKPCSEPCDRVQCNEPCRKVLPKCGHACVGLCGELCPKLCRVCDLKKIKKLFGADMDVSTARFVQLEDCHHMVEVSALDQWMTSTADAEKGGLQLKVCPQCHTPIRHHLRYGAFIKTQIEDIETVKRRILGEGREKKSLLARLKKDMLNTRSIPFIKMKQKVFEAGHKETVGGLLTVRNQMRLLEEMRVIRCIARNERIQRFSFYDAMTKMEDWALRPRRAFSRQEVADAEAEIQRLWHWLALLGYLGKNDPMVYPRCVARAEKLKPAIRQMKEGARYTESHQGPMKELLKEVEKQFPAKERRFLPTCEEKPSLNLKVTPVGQGHWCKCPVGHIYACEDSADSATVSHCPECK